MPLPLKGCMWFFTKLVLVYSVLIGLTPILGKPYAIIYRGIGAVAYESVGDHFNCQFIASGQEKNRIDTSLIIMNLRSGAAKKLGLSSYAAGYQPMAILTAFALAIPIGRRRRFWTLALGFALVQTFAALSLGTLIWNKVTLDPGLQSTSPSTTTWVGLNVLLAILSGWPVGGFLVPIFAVILVTFRRADWDRFQQWAVSAGNAPQHIDRVPSTWHKPSRQRIRAESS